MQRGMSGKSLNARRVGKEQRREKAKGGRNPKLSSPTRCLGRRSYGGN